MKKNFLSRLTATGFLLSLFLTAAVLISSAHSVFADVKKPKNKIADSKKQINRSSKKKKSKKKFVAKFNRKQSKRAVEPPRTEDEFEGNAEKREDWFMSQRTYPFAELPADARRQAWLSRPVDARRDGNAPLSQWQAIGPKPTSSYFPNNWGLTSGRINAIAVSPSNPQLILVGAATGGVWRSTDGGANFVPTSDGQVDLAVGSIAFAPSNNSIVYAGMGDKAQGYLGTGVLKSTDGGQTWVRVNNQTLPSKGRISAIEVDAANPNRVYVAQFSSQQGNTASASGFWLSADGGVNWTRTSSGLPRDLVRHPTQPNTYYLAMQRVDGTDVSTGGVLKSVDAGQTWTRIYTAPFATTSNIKIAVTPSAPQNVYVVLGSGGTGRMEVSTDEGATWMNRGAAFDTGQLNYNFYLFVHPTDPNTIFVGTRDLWRTQDGGAIYTNITRNFTITGGYTPTQARAHPDQHHFYISPANPNLIYIANDGGLWRSTDGANTFQTLNSTLGLTMFTSLDLHPTDRTKTYGGTQDNGTQRRNGTQSWREFATGDGGQVVVDAVDPSIIFVTYVFNTVYRYVNSGDNFAATIGSDAIFGSDRVAFYPPFIGSEVNSNLYFGTYRLYVSTDRGVNWTAPGGEVDLTNGGNDTLSTIGISRSNPNVIYTGSGQGRVSVSTDGGVTWVTINTGLPTRFIKDISVSPTNSNTAYLTVSGYLSGHVFKTTNAGASWTDISGNLPDIPTNDLLIDPRNAATLYVGTDIGVFRSTTDGNVWETFNTGLPPTIISELDAQPNGLMQVGTYGRGAFEINLSVGSTKFDFDGDGKSDVSVFRPGNGAWYLNQSTTGFTGVQFGQSGDKIAPADYDGDGKTDVAVYRGGTWYLNRSSLGFTGVAFGLATDIPQPADYDGDGKADLAVYRPSNGSWYVYNLANNQVNAVQFGASEDKPVAADYDGDGKTDYAVFRPSSGIWYILRSQAGFTGIQFGNSTDRPTPADYDGDGKADIAVFRPSNGTWYLNQSQLGFTGVSFGLNTDIPSPADYDGDGKADVAVFRPSSGNWYLLRSQAGLTGVAFGVDTDIPVPSAFVP